MLRYVRAAVGLLAAVLVAVMVNRLMQPQLAEGAFGNPGVGSLIGLGVDLLAFCGGWVLSGMLFANKRIGRVLELLVEGTGSAVAPMVAAPVAGAAMAAHNDAPVQLEPMQEPEPWSEEEELAGRLALRGLKGGDAADYLRAFRLLHPESDYELAEAFPQTVETAAAEPQTTTRKPRTARK